jgi:outer membrane cobalamin receptor
MSLTGQWVLAQESSVDSMLLTGQGYSVPSEQSMQFAYVITSDEIEHMNAQNLNDVLRYTINALPVYVGTDGYSLDYLGNGRKSVRILLNGLPVWQTSIDRIDLSRWPIHDADRIEILYGTSTVLYGSNANAAVINIIGKWRKNKISQNVLNANFTGKNEYNFRFVNYLNISRHKISFGIGRYFFGGYNGTDSNRVSQWKPSLNTNGQLRYSYLLQHELEAYINVNYVHSTVIDRGYPIPNSLRVYDKKQLSGNLLLHGGIRGKVSKYHSIDFSHVYTRFKLDNEKSIKILSDLKSEPDPEKLPFDQLKYDEYFSQIKISRHNETKPLDYEVGMEFSHQRDLQNSVLEAVKTNITQISLLSIVTYRARPDFWLRGGLRYTNSNKFNTPLLFNGQFRYLMSEQAQLLVQYSKGFRTPTFNELFYTYENPNLNIKGNLSLQSEAYNLINTTLRISSENVTVATTMFWQNTQNGIQLIAVNPDEQIYQFVNTKSAKFIAQSISVQTRHDIVDTRFIFANNGVNQFPEEIGSYYFFQELSGQVRLKIPAENFSLMYLVKYNGKRFEIRKNALGLLEDFSQQGFWLMDVSILAHAFDNRLDIAVGIKNLNDIKNVAGKFLPLDRISDDEINSKLPLSIDFGRRGWLSITAKF